jgi:hypothetical protein
MQVFYTRYKEMKRVIRDDAAVDIQRCARGFVVRSRISRFSRTIYNANENLTGKSKGSGIKDGTGRKGSPNRSSNPSLNCSPSYQSSPLLTPGTDKEKFI